MATFQGSNGHRYRVSLSGDAVENGTIVLAGESPVIISMAAGERKFVGFKSQTCKVKIVTDTPLLDLYGNSATSVAIKVYDGTDVIFRGYVVPFAYSQPYDGRCDVVEINAVDCITARQQVTYTNFGEPYGTDRTGLAIVQELCLRAGVSRIVEHVNFSAITYTGESPLNIPVAQAGFLQDEVGEVDVLSAIAKFFGYTAHVYGDTLYLYDEHYLTHSDEARSTDANVYTLSDGVFARTEAWHEGKSNKGARVVEGDGDFSPLAAQGIYLNNGILSGVTINVERAYDGVQITPEGADTSVLLPDVCADDNLEDNDNSLGNTMSTLQENTKDADYVQWRTPRKSKLMTFGVASGDSIVDGWGDISSPMTSNNWYNGAIPMKLVHAPRKRATLYGEDIIAPEIKYDGNVVWVRPMLSNVAADVYVGEQRGDKRYSHTGGLVKLTMTWFTTPNNSYGNIDDKLSDDTIRFINFISIANGNRYFVSDNASGKLPVWSTTKQSAKLLHDNGKLLPTNAAVNRYQSSVIISADDAAQVVVRIGWNMATDKIYSDHVNIFIESLTLEGYGDKLDTTYKDLRHEYNDGNDYIEASTMLTTRESGFIGALHEPINSRASVVPSRYWVGGYMARNDSEAIPISGILMEQLRERYGDPHKAYTMTVGKLLTPYKMTRYNGEKYTVEAYDMDIYNSRTTITIN